MVGDHLSAEVFNLLIRAPLHCQIAEFDLRQSALRGLHDKGFIRLLEAVRLTLGGADVCDHQRQRYCYGEFKVFHVGQVSMHASIERGISNLLPAKRRVSDSMQIVPAGWRNWFALHALF
jgi:hypothetical protein